MKQKFNSHLDYEKTHRLNLYPDSYKQYIVDSIQALGKEIGLVRIEQKNALKVLLCNLYFIRNEKIRTPRAKKSLGSLRYNPLKIGYKSLITVLDKLVTHKFITQELGFRDVTWEESKMTTVISTDKLSDWFNENNWTHLDINWQDEELLILRRDNKNNEMVDYVDGVRSTRIRDELTKYNELINDTEILVLNKKGDIVNEYNDLILRRIFVSYDKHEVNSDADLFSFGGRMYGPWCNLNEKQRSNITLNGNKTVEIDLEASHINAMYGSITGKPYQYGDPYNELYVDGYLIPRHIVKQVATIMQFSKNTQGTAAGLEGHYFPSVDFSIKKKQQSKKDLERAKEYKYIKSLVKPGAIIRQFLKRHKDIAWHYHKGRMMGHHIQYWESSFVFRIVNQLTNKQIPVLTVYDSFIVEEQYKDVVHHLISSTPYKDNE